MMSNTLVLIGMTVCLSLATLAHGETPCFKVDETCRNAEQLQHMGIESIRMAQQEGFARQAYAYQRNADGSLRPAEGTLLIENGTSAANSLSHANSLFREKGIQLYTTLLQGQFHVEGASLPFTGNLVNIKPFGTTPFANDLSAEGICRRLTEHGTEIVKISCSALLSTARHDPNGTIVIEKLQHHDCKELIVPEDESTAQLTVWPGDGCRASAVKQALLERFTGMVLREEQGRRLIDQQGRIMKVDRVEQESNSRP